MVIRVVRTVFFAALLVELSSGLAKTEGAASSLRVPGRASANASVAAAGAFVAVVWGATRPGGATDIFAATSINGGTSFGAPVQVSMEGSRASLSGEQPPRVALTPLRNHAPAITVVWTTKQSDGTRLVTTQSIDGGRTFATPTVVAGGPNAPGNRGWQAIASTGTGVVAVWLDHRDTAGHGDHAMHQHGTNKESEADADPTARAQLSKLWFARVDDATTAKPVASGVCYCCKTTIATGSSGTIYAAWRHVYPGSRRDIALATSRDGGRTFSEPIRVSQDDWQIDGCPENGPSLAVDSRGRIHLVWPTLTRDSGRDTLALFYTTSSDGHAFSRRQRIPITTAAAYHPQLVVQGDGRLLVAWDELQNGARRIRMASGAAGADGAVRFSAIRLSGDDEGAYPVVASTNAGPIAVWSTKAGSSLVVQRIGS